MANYYSTIAYPSESEIKTAAREDVSRIIKNKITDHRKIENTLDSLLALVSSNSARRQLQKLLTYYQTINFNQSELYRNLYEEELSLELIPPLTEENVEQLLEQGVWLELLVSERIGGIVENINTIISGGLTSSSAIKPQLDEILSYVAVVNDVHLLQELEIEFNRLNGYLLKIDYSLAKRYEENYQSVL